MSMNSYRVLAAIFLCAALVMAVANFISHFVGGSNDLTGHVSYLMFISGFLVFRFIIIEEKIRELENSTKAQKTNIQIDD